MKVYTKTGDKGTTGLFSGERVSKTDSRVEAYGSVDELNSTIGVLTSFIPENAEPVGTVLQQIQTVLFESGSWLATTPDSPNISRLKEVDADMVSRLEDAIDHMTAELSELKGFILPGGTQAASFAHLARSICRRVERNVLRVEMDDTESRSMEQIGKIKIVLNRLSDYFFTLARYLNHLENQPDKLWKS